MLLLAFLQPCEVCGIFSRTCWIKTLCPFVLKLNYITLAKTLQSSLPTVSLADLLPGRHIFTLSWHVCSFLFIPPSLLCTFSSVHQLGSTPVGVSSPHQKALFTLRDLGEPAVLQASPDGREECDGAGERYRAPTILTTPTSSESSLNQRSRTNRCLKPSYKAPVSGCRLTQMKIKPV